jgi:NADH-quinone oxidoreductase subunit L
VHGVTEHPHGVLAQLLYPFAHAPVAAFIGLIAVAAGLVAAFKLYHRASEDPLPAKLGGAARWLRDKFYFDELYEATVIRLQDTIAAVTDWFDRWLVGGAAVRGTAAFTGLVGQALRLVQTGSLQTYAFLFVLGTAILLIAILGT